MKKDVQEKLVAALRSGKYVQGQNVLRQQIALKWRPDEFCCLGVLCEIAVEAGVIPPAQIGEGSSYVYRAADNPDDMSVIELPHAVADWAEMTSNGELICVDADGANSLMALNDMGQSFDYIANVIESGAVQ